MEAPIGDEPFGCLPNDGMNGSKLRTHVKRGAWLYTGGYWRDVAIAWSASLVGGR